jgi:acetate kinase
MNDTIAVLNAGSSSIKFSLFELDEGGPRASLRGQIEGLGTAPHFIARNADGKVLAQKHWGKAVRLEHSDALDYLVPYLSAEIDDANLRGVGHRVVHGGLAFGAPIRVDAEVVSALEALAPLAPLHQPHNLAPIKLLLERAPRLPQVACFDTAFHHTNPPLAQRFALPRALHEEGVRRYGFHGLSYEYIAGVLEEYDERTAAGRTVVLHLGNGASMCALQAGRSVTTTTGFTAVEGLPMGTRSGSLDPGVILHLIAQRGMSVAQVEHLIYHESGLLGVSGVSSDMRTLLASDEPDARLAVDLFAYRIGRELGSLAAALGGLDAIVFTAGIGEHAAPLRERVCRGAKWLGVELDEAANAAHGPRISTATSAVSAWVIPTDEELLIARHTARLLG